jgi:hypothetical protein
MGSRIESLGHLNKATRQSPVTLEGPDTALDEQHMELALAGSKGDNINGDRGALESIRVVWSGRVCCTHFYPVVI